MDEYNNQNVEVVYGEAAVEPIIPQKKGFAIAALVLGIISVFPGCCCYFMALGLILGVLAIVFALIFLNANKGLLVSKGMAIAGLVLGGLGILIFIITLVFGLIGMKSGAYDEMIQEFMNGIEQSIEQNQ